MFKRAAVLVVSCGALLAGCGTDAQDENEEILSNLREAGIPAEHISVIDDAVYLGGDGHVTLQASREMNPRGEGSQEHWRHPNLISPNVTKICLIPTATFNSYIRLSQGLDAAIANYNALGLRIFFARGAATGCTANISVRTMSGTGGSAGYPSNGLPYGVLNIGTGLQAYSLDVNEHVITHELGHTLGILHSDIYGSTTCPGSGNPPTGFTPVHIPGTPTTSPNGGSIFNSCFNSTASGEFTSTDITALNVLFGR